MFRKKSGHLLLLSIIISFGFICMVISHTPPFLGGLFSAKKIIKIRFSQAHPLPDNMNVYYKGVKVGIVSDTDFSDDYKYTYLIVELNKKDFGPPRNIYAEIKLEGQAELSARSINITKYLELIYPEKPSDIPLLENDIIEGKEGDLAKIQNALAESVDKENIKSSINDFQEIALNTKEVSKNLAELSIKLNDFFDANRVNLNKIVKNIQSTTTNSNDLSLNLAKTVKSPHISKTLANLSELTAKTIVLSSKLDKISYDIDKITGNPCFQNSILNTSFSLAVVAGKLDQTIDPCEVKQLIKNTDRLVNRYDDLGLGLAEIMGKPAPGLQLLFGKPGKHFEKTARTFPPFYLPNHCYSYNNYTFPAQGYYSSNCLNLNQE